MNLTSLFIIFFVYLTQIDSFDQNFFKTKFQFKLISWNIPIVKHPLSLIGTGLNGEIPPTPPINYNEMNQNWKENGKKAINFLFPVLNLTRSDHNTTSTKELKKRYGLLIILQPTFMTQIKLLQTILPFIFDRLIQYISPINLLTAIALMYPKGRQFITTSLMGSVALGSLFMLSDTFLLGNKWNPLIATNDSYALITG